MLCLRTLNCLCPDDDDEEISPVDPLSDDFIIICSCCSVCVFSVIESNSKLLISGMPNTFRRSIMFTLAVDCPTGSFNWGSKGFITTIYSSYRSSHSSLSLSLTSVANE